LDFSVTSLEKNCNKLKEGGLEKERGPESFQAWENLLEVNAILGIPGIERRKGVTRRRWHAKLKHCHFIELPNAQERWPQIVEKNLSSDAYLGPQKKEGWGLEGATKRTEWYV